MPNFGEQHEIMIASLVCMTLFSLSVLFSLSGLFLSRKTASRAFFRLFFAETFLISLFELGSGVVVYFDSVTPGSVRLEVAQRCINNFSLIFQFSLILTIAYGWKATCWRIKESSCLNFSELRTRRAVYLSVSISLMTMWLIASCCLVGYLLLTGSASEMVMNSFDLALEVSVLSACVAQMAEGRRLSSLLTAYKIKLGVRVQKCRVSIMSLSSTSSTSWPSR